MAGAAAVQIRFARPDDETALKAVDRAAWSSMFSPAEFDPERPFLRPGVVPGDILVAELQGTVVGYAQLGHPTPLPANVHVVEIQGLAVDPAAQRRGVATALLEAAAAEARGRGARKLSLRVMAHNHGARALYERAGFVIEGVLREEFLVDGAFVDDVLMARRA